MPSNAQHPMPHFLFPTPQRSAQRQAVRKQSQQVLRPLALVPVRDKGPNMIFKFYTASCRYHKGGGSIMVWYREHFSIKDELRQAGLLRASQVAELLGVSVDTISRWSNKGRMPAGFKIGGRVGPTGTPPR